MAVLNKTGTGSLKQTGNIRRGDQQFVDIGHGIKDLTQIPLTVQKIADSLSTLPDLYLQGLVEMLNLFLVSFDLFREQSDRHHDDKEKGNPHCKVCPGNLCDQGVSAHHIADCRQQGHDYPEAEPKVDGVQADQQVIAKEKTYIITCYMVLIEN